MSKSISKSKKLFVPYRKVMSTIVPLAGRAEQNMKQSKSPTEPAFGYNAVCQQAAFRGLKSALKRGPKNKTHHGPSLRISQTSTG